MLTLGRAKEINRDMITQEHLILHSLNVMAAMGAMAEHFGEDKEHWMAIGYLHDFDYEKYPQEHLQHTKEALLAAGVEEDDVRAILSHGYGMCTDIRPETLLEKSLYTVDELTGVIQAYARMRPEGMEGMELSGLMKKFKDKRFAAGCSREVILQGAGMLGMDIREICAICIRGMDAHKNELGLTGNRSERNGG